MLFIPNSIYRFSAITIKISCIYFIDIDKLILEFMQKDKTLKIANVRVKKRKWED